MKLLLTLLSFSFLFSISANARSLKARTAFEACERIERAAGTEHGNECIELLINQKTNPYANAVCYRIAGSSIELGLDCVSAIAGNVYENIDKDLFKVLERRAGSDMEGTIEKLKTLNIE